MNNHYLVDISGFIYRAYHAIPHMHRSDGLMVNAVNGYMNMMVGLMFETQAEYLVAVFDAKRGNFRHEIYPAYKANRPPVPEDLAPQFPLIREATAALNVPMIELDGYEADDVIATLARRVREAGERCIIVSSDKDLMQLVGPEVMMLDTMAKRLIGVPQVIEKFGVPPHQVPDVQALCGDAIDHVPGVPKIGIKTATALIEQFGSLEDLLRRVGEVEKKAPREALQRHADDARLSLRLVRLCDTVPVEFDLAQMAVRAADKATLLGFLAKMEFRHLIEKIEAGAGGASSGRERPAIGAVSADPLDEEGYFRTRRGKGYPWVAARIWKVGFETYAAIGGQQVNPAAPPGWPWTRITEDEYRFMMADAEWCRANAPEEPQADPDRPISKARPNLLPPKE